MQRRDVQLLVLIALVAILFLALGDTVSGLAGSMIRDCDVRRYPADLPGAPHCQLRLHRAIDFQAPLQAIDCSLQ